MLYLKEKELIGKGRHRKCYAHPEEPGKCVKIVVFGDMKETKRERAFYRLLERRKTSMAMISKYYGTVSTNMGAGFVFELIRDFDGRVSETLENCLSGRRNLGFDFSDLLQSIDLLKSYMLREKIITMTLKPKNIVYKRIDRHSGHLVIVDGIGNSDFLPLCEYFDFFARKKVERRWKRFEAALKPFFRNLAGREKQSFFES